MFSCTKNFNIKTTYGIQRIVFISAIITIVVFLISFEIFISLVSNRFTDKNFLLFLFSLLAIYPVHKIIHLLAFIGDTRSLVIQKITRKSWPPLLNIRVNHPVSKLHFTIALLLPFTLITAAAVTAAVMMPQYGHYLLFIGSVNAGISFIDFIYLKYIIKTPRGTFIEERRYGLELLIKCNG
ncbi:DUF3267 domain-containing protein [Macrococcus equipercicus]|uniref:DUF3267 domain-containing protein n=1 Tax=Macrococcus equipercicus TaxID=69967 RepID=A0A9Q9BVU9_9STAP|nr:DUF3267 domain-containing protein [Macrococcus equipercicus]UTH13342.1 DUF3267 domain-containing protein [Macrococcus equipercicus]